MTIHVGIIKDDSGRTLDPVLAAQAATALAFFARVLNDRAFVERVEKMYRESGPISAVDGLDWFGPPSDEQTRTLAHRPG